MSGAISAVAATTVGIDASAALAGGSLAAATTAAALPSLATAGTALSAVSAGVGALGQLQSARAASNSANYNAQVAANNAKLQTQNAALAGAEGEANAGNAAMRTRAEVGSIKTAQAASGVDVNSGSAVDVRSSASELGELNALTIRSNAAKQAYGFQTAATSDTAQSQLDKAQASYASEAGDIGAANTFLGGESNAALNYAKFRSSNGLNTD